MALETHMEMAAFLSVRIRLMYAVLGAGFSLVARRFITWEE